MMIWPAFNFPKQNVEEDFMWRAVLLGRLLNWLSNLLRLTDDLIYFFSFTLIRSGFGVSFMFWNLGKWQQEKWLLHPRVQSDQIPEEEECSICLGEGWTRAPEWCDNCDGTGYLCLQTNSMQEMLENRRGQ